MTTLIYLHVAKSGYPEAPPPEYYLPYSRRFAETYKKFRPETDHRLIVCLCGDENAEAKNVYDGLNVTFDVYLGAGSDIGACQYVLKKVPDEFAVCMSTPVYFWKHGWLEKLAEARQKHGDGLYGPMASLHVNPHIRTSCWAVDPKTFAQYPNLVDTREKACWFEHANKDWVISKWYEDNKKPAMLVTWDQVLERKDWRTPPNIFRRGDQSNCLVRDQHWDKYAAAHYHERLAMEKQADGNENSFALPKNPEEV